LSEALEEAKQIKSAFQANANRIELVTLDGTDATVDKVVEALSKPFDVFHYAGHASFDSNNPANSGLHLVDQWLTPDRIVSTGSDAIRIPPLVVLNACTSARVRGQDHPDPVEKPLSPSLAEAILVAGARTFIGTFWNVFDTAAAKFSKELYRRLLSGDSVGTAVLGGRRMLDAEKERDWVNYNLYGDTELRW
jgi:CHAT domain-containing protein